MIAVAALLETSNTLPAADHAELPTLTPTERPSERHQPSAAATDAGVSTLILAERPRQLTTEQDGKGGAPFLTERHTDDADAEERGM
jgi:hypothetical protein